MRLRKPFTASYLIGGLLTLPSLMAVGQSERKPVGQPGIYFPQVPRPGAWRKSIGVVFTTTPPELTEEVRIRVPAIDINLQRRLSNQWFVVGRLQTQLVQSNLGLGLRWAKPITSKLLVSAGYDVAGWFGALRVRDVFDSQAYGLQSYPNVSVGYRPTKDLQLTLKSEAILDLYYRSQVGSLAVVYNRRAINGMAFTFIVEQPFFKKQHALLGFRAAYSNFNWQFWSLYDTFDRHIFYPQLVFGFIL